MKISPLLANWQGNFTNYKTKNIEKNKINLTFTGLQTTPFSDEDYKKALENLHKEVREAKKKDRDGRVELKTLDMNKINGIQKDIKVFEGLTMGEIAFMLECPSILLNRCCSSNCAHCGFMATPFSNATLDRMSWEDFSELISGIRELSQRLAVEETNPLFLNSNLFQDSDCMEIELRDKDGNIYDYLDCVRFIQENNQMHNTFSTPLFDTSGWNPKSEKMQKRAEKFVYQLTNEFDKNPIRQFNVSINPYHLLRSQAQKERSNFHFRKARELEEAYAERMANALFTLTPVQDKLHFNVLSRWISPSKTNKGELSGPPPEKAILKKLKKMYTQDYKGEQKYIKSEYELKRTLDTMNWVIRGTEEYTSPDIEPWGRAENLVKNPKTTSAQREAEMLAKINQGNANFARLINPNGSVILNDCDISARTNLAFNFQNSHMSVKPFAHEIKDFVYEYREK